MPPQPTSTPFPYTTLFRSLEARRDVGRPPRDRRRREPGKQDAVRPAGARHAAPEDRKSTRLNSSHTVISYAVFCLKKKKTSKWQRQRRRFLPRIRTHQGSL